MDREDATVSTRIPKTLRELMRKHILEDTHMNESEFIRDAIRRELERHGISYQLKEDSKP